MFPLQGKAEVLSQNILRWEEKSKQPITAFFDFANLPCPEGETLKGSVNTIIVSPTPTVIVSMVAFPFHPKKIYIRCCALTVMFMSLGKIAFEGSSQFILEFLNNNLVRICGLRKCN